MSLKEGKLLDYLVASFIGLAFAMVVASPAGGEAGHWGPYIGILFVAGIFGFIPGGIVASYINSKFHKMADNKPMAGLGAGVFTAVVYAIINLMTTTIFAIADTTAAAAVFIAWILSTIFAFIFISAGGYIWGILEEKQLQMPEFFNFSKGSNFPPPPPPVTQQCLTCEKPLVLTKQHNG